MSISELHIHSLRNLTSARLSLHPRYNLFIGPNGSGKTSILEAIYLLGTGHSFRSREISPLIRYGEKSLTIFATTTTDSISIQKSLSGPTQVKVNTDFYRQSSSLAYLLPCQVFHQDIFQIMDAGPAVRRSLLDWGVFHVKQYSYHLVWKDYRRVLRQRNALLRQQAAPNECYPWDELLVKLGEELHGMRHDYFQSLGETFQHFLLQLTDVPCTIHYDKGWDKRESGKSFQEILGDQFVSDAQRQYTQSGPHQAEITFSTQLPKAKQVLSRGQQKMILIALKLAQARLVGKPCVYLLDDVFAELDKVHIHRLLSTLEQTEGQFFFTATENDMVQKYKLLENAAVFSLQDGQVSSFT